jgi:hypothetical protein
MYKPSGNNFIGVKAPIRKSTHHKRSNDNIYKAGTSDYGKRESTHKAGHHAIHSSHVLLRGCWWRC